MTRDITHAPRIAVLQSRTSNIVVLFVDLEGHVLELAFGFIGDLEAYGAGADYDHAEGTLGVGVAQRWRSWRRIGGRIHFRGVVLRLGCVMLVDWGSHGSW